MLEYFLLVHILLIFVKVSSSQPTINEPIQAAEASSAESTTSLLTVLSPSTINTGTATKTKENFEN